MESEWFTGHQLRPGTLVGEWERPFTLWGYSGSHSRLLLRSVKYHPGTDPARYPDEDTVDSERRPDAWPRTRIDILFKPVEAVCLRQTRYPSLRIRVAGRERADAVIGGLPQTWPSGRTRGHIDERVLELIGPDGVADHIVCMAVGHHEDDGEYWDPSPFIDDLANAGGTPWPCSPLGGSPDGNLNGR